MSRLKYDNASHLALKKISLIPLMILTVLAVFIVSLPIFIFNFFIWFLLFPAVLVCIEYGFMKLCYVQDVPYSILGIFRYSFNSFKDSWKKSSVVFIKMFVVILSGAVIVFIVLAIPFIVEFFHAFSQGTGETSSMSGTSSAAFIALCYVFETAVMTGICCLLNRYRYSLFQTFCKCSIHCSDDMRKYTIWFSVIQGIMLSTIILVQYLKVYLNLNVWVMQEIDVLQAITALIGFVCLYRTYIFDLSLIMDVSNYEKAHE